VPRHNEIHSFHTLIQLSQQLRERADEIKNAAEQFLKDAGESTIISLAHGATIQKGLDAAKRMVDDLSKKSGDRRYHIMPSSLFGETTTPLPPKNKNTPKPPKNNGHKRRGTKGKQ
jgi:hypothetical protein